MMDDGMEDAAWEDRIQILRLILAQETRMPSS
jgi:hypothetical protein